MKKKREMPRGFVIIIVLAVAAVLTAVVAAQYLTASKGQVSAIRGSEEVRARGIAEACLAMASTYVRNFDPTPDPGDDFDVVLGGPDGIGNTADDYLINASPKINIPDTLTGIPAAEQRLHQWGVVDIPGTGGVCAVRIDDNADDGRPAIIPDPVACAVAENTGVERPFCDSDRSVVVTVIGIYPGLASDTGVYEKAHARVTLRSAVQLPNVVQSLAPSLWADGNINLQNFNHVCARGGMRSRTGALGFAGTSCACGPLEAVNMTDPQITAVGATCGGCGSVVFTPQCLPASRPALDTSAVPKSVHPTDRRFMANAALGRVEMVPVAEVSTTPGGYVSGTDVQTAGSEEDLSDASVCSFFGTSDGKLFVWDGKDTAARSTLEATAGVAAAAFAATIPTDDNCTDPAISAGTGAPKLLPRPCTWAETVGPPRVWTVTCAAGESACWKLIADLDGTAVATIVSAGDESVAPNPDQEWTALTGTDEGWHPHKNIQIPNAAIGASSPFDVDGRGFATTAAADRLCGPLPATPPCTNCQTGAVSTNAAGPAIVFLNATSTWSLGGAARNDLFPTPAVMFFDGNVTINTTGGGTLVTGQSGLLQATIVSSGNVTLNNDAALCCARCDCNSLGNTTNISGSCEFTDTLGGGADGPVVALRNDNDGDSTDADLDTPGHAVKAVGTIQILDTAGFFAPDIVGDLRAGVVDIDEDFACIIGNVVSYSTTASCTWSCATSSVCIDDNSHVVGDVHSMRGVFFDNDQKVYGNIIAKGSFCADDGAKIEGVIQAGGTITLDQDALVANTTVATGVGTPVIANAALTTYLESTW